MPTSTIGIINCMNTPNRAIVIGGVVAAAVIGGVVTLLLHEKQDYRDWVTPTFANARPTDCAGELTATARWRLGNRDFVRHTAG